MVLDAFGKYTHFADANRIRTWLDTGKVTPVPESAISYKKQRALQQRQVAQNDLPNSEGITVPGGQYVFVTGKGGNVGAKGGRGDSDLPPRADWFLFVGATGGE